MRKERMNRELSDFPIVKDALAKKKQRQKDADRETYQVVTKDLVRKLKVPREAPPGHNIMIDNWDLNRIRQNARVMTKEELEENAKRIKEINEMMEMQDGGCLRRNGKRLRNPENLKEIEYSL